MSVHFDPKGDCFCFGVSNSTWFELVRKGGPLHKVLGPDMNHLTNDPIDADNEISQRCAEAMSYWNPPNEWFSPGKEHEAKNMFIDFFRQCDGFNTH
jgi:hypothetical protein